MNRFSQLGRVRRLLDVTGLSLWRLSAVVAASGVQALLMAPAPLFVQRAFDAATTGTFHALVIANLTLIGFLLAGELIGASVRVSAAALTKPAVQRVRTRLSHAIAHLPMDLVEPQSPYVHDVYVHDTQRVEGLLNITIGQLLPAALVVVTLSIALALTNALFGVAAAIAAVVVAGAERLTRSLTKPRLDASHRAFGEFSRGAWSMLAGFLVTRTHGAEPVASRAREDEARVLGDSNEGVSRAWAFNVIVGRGAAVTVFGVLLLWAGLEVQRGHMSIPVMLAVTSTIALLRGPLYTIGVASPQAQEGWSAWDRICALIDAAAENTVGGTAPPQDAPLVLDRVGCRFGRTTIFSNVSLTIKAGETIALTGPNGAGKTTLVRQVLGLTRPSEGAIRVGSVDFESLDLAAWRRSIGVVLQETWFFDGTIAENLVYGRSSATEEDVRDACALARVDEFVRDLPDGLQTKIGGDGVKLSQGQRQRLAIARALVRRPQLLILDEPTNHLDEVSARSIMSALMTRPNRPATLLITHTPDYAAAADRVLRLADGRLTELDRHADLVEIMRADTPLTKRQDQ